MPDAKARSTAKATVIAKVIRADGTEETYVSEDVSVTDLKTVTEALRVLDKDEGGQ
jgi:hypothetical protein